jgi:hypothetical protein
MIDLALTSAPSRERMISLSNLFEVCAMIAAGLAWIPARF